MNVDPTARVISEIAAERRRQQETEGFDAAHDDDHLNGDIGVAAAAYAVVSASQHDGSLTLAKLGLELWPWNMAWWKPRSPRNNLIRAAALLVAEIERLDRKAGK